MNLFETVRNALRTQHYAYRTERTYITMWGSGVVSPLDTVTPQRRDIKRTVAVES